MEYITYANILLNLDESLTEAEKLKYLEEKTSLYSGDWSHFSDLTKESEKYDVILTSETIYNIDNQQKLLDTFASRLKPDGIVLIAAKSYYFGVGGGLDQFVEKIREGNVFLSESVWHAEENLKRGILQLKFK